MAHKQQQNITKVILFVGTLSLAVFACAYVWHNLTLQKASSYKSQITEPDYTVDEDTPAHIGKISQQNAIIIKEWGISFVPPDNFSSDDSVVYILSAVEHSPDNSLVQAARLYIADELVRNHACATTEIRNKKYIDSAIQLIRADASKTFDAMRYRWVFKQDIAKTGAYNIHLNYVKPDCFPGESSGLLKELQESLIHIKIIH